MTETSNYVELTDEELAQIVDDGQILPDPYLDDPEWDGVQDSKGTVDGAGESMSAALQTAINTTPETLKALRNQHLHPTQSWYRLCLGLATFARDIPPHYLRAFLAWTNAKAQHRLTLPTDWGKVPRGAPIFYHGPLEGGVEYGHVTTFVGVTQVGPMCWSNDVKTAGHVDMVNVLFPVSHWGHTLVGWTGDLNTVDLNLTIPTGPPPSLPTVSLAKVVSAARHDPARPQGGTTAGAKDDVLVVEKALVAIGRLEARYVDGSFGTATRAAYRGWQRHLGYTGTAADGIPGHVSLTRLGHLRHFNVVA